VNPKRPSQQSLWDSRTIQFQAAICRYRRGRCILKASADTPHLDHSKLSQREQRADNNWYGRDCPRGCSHLFLVKQYMLSRPHEVSAAVAVEGLFIKSLDLVPQLRVFYQVFRLGSAVEGLFIKSLDLVPQLRVFLSSL
jgi:hypothetical protein